MATIDENPTAGPTEGQAPSDERAGLGEHLGTRTLPTTTTILAVDFNKTLATVTSMKGWADIVDSLIHQGHLSLDIVQCYRNRLAAKSKLA